MVNRDPMLRRIVSGGVIAAAYAALSLALSPLSFGPVQIRLAEALTLLPVLYAPAVWGVTLGCAITNAVGAATGANFLGALDILAGSAATLLSALLTRALRDRRFRGLPLLASLPPVLVNAAVIGAEWCWATAGAFKLGLFALCALQIAAGQLLPCCALGVALVRALEKRGLPRQ